MPQRLTETADLPSAGSVHRPPTKRHAIPPGSSLERSSGTTKRCNNSSKTSRKLKGKPTEMVFGIEDPASVRRPSSWCLGSQRAGARGVVATVGDEIVDKVVVDGFELELSGMGNADTICSEEPTTSFSEQSSVGDVERVAQLTDRRWVHAMVPSLMLPPDRVKLLPRLEYVAGRCKNFEYVLSVHETGPRKK